MGEQQEALSKRHEPQLLQESGPHPPTPTSASCSTWMPGSNSGSEEGSSICEEPTDAVWAQELHEVIDKTAWNRRQPFGAFYNKSRQFGASNNHFTLSGGDSVGSQQYRQQVLHPTNAVGALAENEACQPGQTLRHFLV